MRWAVFVALLVFGLSGDARAGDRGDATAAPLVLAQSSLAVIDAPRRLKTDQETVDFSGRVIAPGEVTLTVNGAPVKVAPDGSFRIRQEVPVGRTDLLLVLEGSYGDRAEHKVLVRRAAAVAEGPAVYGRFHALVIGNNAYKHLSDLEMAVVDAEAVAEMLERHYGFDVEVLVDATRYDIISALSRLRAELNETDNLLIYYAGHGSLDIGSDEGYWLPVDAEPDNPVNWVSNNDISGQLRAMSAKHVMVVADSCYSGKLTRNVAASLKTGAERTAWLKRMNGRRSRTALTSGGLEPVLDAGGGGHSVFAKAFLDALEGNTDILDGQALFDAIKRPIVVNADQTPEYADVRKAGHDGGDFLFVPIAVTPTTTVATAAPAAPAAPAIAPAEVALWSAVKDSQFAADYQAYLDAYPAGVYAPLAKARIARLEAGAESRAAVQGSAAELAFWQAIKDSAEAADYQAYLSQFPEGAFAALATLRLATFGQAVAEAERKSAEEAARREATRLAAEEAKRQEAERKAAEAAARREATRLAAEAEAKRVAAEEAAHVAAEEAKRKEAAEEAARATAEAEAKRKASERQAAEEAARKRAERKAAEAEAKRLAVEEAKRQEAARKAAEAQVAAAQRQARERALWDTIKDSNRAIDYRVYLQQFPGGTYAVLARARMAEAERLAAEQAKRNEEERKAAEKAKAEQAFQTAMLAPSRSSFNGKWILEIVDLESDAMERKNVQIANNEFNVAYSLDDVAGNFAGSIDQSDRLRAVMSALLKKNTRFKTLISRLKVNTAFANGKFEAEAGGWLAVNTAVSVPKKFRIRLIRVSLPQTGSESGGSEAQQGTQTALLTAPPAPSIVVDKAEVEKDDHLKSVIKKYFNALLSG